MKNNVATTELNVIIRKLINLNKSAHRQMNPLKDNKSIKDLELL